MLNTDFLSHLVSQARNPELTSREFEKLISEIAEYVNHFGTDAFEAFKGHFTDFKRLSWAETLSGEGDPKVRANELLLASVLRRLTVRPESTAPNKLPEFLYRGCLVSPNEILEQDGYLRTAGERSLFQHQESTGRSVFISATSELAMACEFAMKGAREQKGQWVYKIQPKNAVSCNEYFSPYSIYSSENEYVFIERLPAAQIVGVAWAKNADELGTDFYALQQHNLLIRDMVDRGYVS
jgi:hypothetical protein